MEPFSFIIEPGDSGCRLDLYLSRKTGESRSFVKSQILKGRILLNGQPEKRAAQKLKAGDTLSGTMQEVFRTELKPVEGNLQVLFEDNEMMALNKPPGLVVHPAAGHRGETLVHHLLHHLQSAPGFEELSPTRPGIVHRLDRGTSGIILVAKNRTALEGLARQFKSRQIQKEYEAVVWGKMKQMEGTFDQAIGRDTKDRKKMSSRTNQGREATTRWKVERAYAHFSHLSLQPKTGRTHQLRVHLAENGTPIVGDPLYGVGSAKRRVQTLPVELQPKVAALPHTLLHARKLSFEHPASGKLMVLEAQRPEVFEIFLTVLEEQDR